MNSRSSRLPVLIAAVISTFAALSPRPLNASLAVPRYSSPGGAVPRIYLDFDGDVTDTWGPFSPGTTPAYDIDGDPTTFSDTELSNIYKIWSGVAEKYSPFNVTVTTAPAPTTLFNGLSMRVVIGGSGDWAPPGSGGIAAWQGFMTSDPNTCYVFPGHLGNGNPRYVAEAAAHEAGHELALDHQSVFNDMGQKTAEYNPGDGTRGPIMGYSYFDTLGQWWYGLDGDTASIQDDLRLLSAKGTARPNFGYRNDDHAGLVPADADPLSVSASFGLSGGGIIELNTDQDFFSFTSPGGLAHLQADSNLYAPMLDFTLTLYDSAGNLITSSSNGILREQIDRLLEPGNYVLGISSAGGFGDIGQYTLSGAVPEPSAAAAVGLLMGYAAARRSRFIRAKSRSSSL